MLTVVRSPEPCVPLDPTGWPEPASDWLQRLRLHPQACHWVVPTTRRCRWLRQAWPVRVGRPAALLPEFHTLPEFVALAHSHAGTTSVQLSDAERRLRMARAWQQVSGRAAGPAFVQHLDRLAHDWQA